MNSRFLFLPMAAVSALCISGSALAQDAKPEGRARNAERFEKTGPKPGEAAPDFELKTLDGKTIRASQLWADKPTLLRTGSETCSVFRREALPFERLAEQFATG